MITKIRIYILTIFFMFISACSNIGNDGYFFGAPILAPGFRSDASPSNSIVVKKGDTLYSLSKASNVPLRDIIEQNNLQAPYILSLGQELSLPHRKYHIVEKGDTLYNISKRYDVDITSLSRVNNLQEPYIISIGDKLSMPASVSYAQIESETSISPVIKPTGTAKSVVPPSKVPQRGRVSSIFAKSKPSPKATKPPVARATKPAKRSVASQQAVVNSRNTKLIWPVKGRVVSSFGASGKGKKNDGINILASQGSKVSAAENGVVVYAGNELKGFGNLVLVKHSRGIVTAYAHNHKLFVRKGEVIKKGQQIASVGQTGGVHSPQLHFEVHVNKKPVNPIPYLP